MRKGKDDMRINSFEKVKQQKRLKGKKPTVISSSAVAKNVLQVKDFIGYNDQGFSDKF